MAKESPRIPPHLARLMCPSLGSPRTQLRLARYRYRTCLAFQRREAERNVKGETPRSSPAQMDLKDAVIPRPQDADPGPGEESEEDPSNYDYEEDEGYYDWSWLKDEIHHNSRPWDMGPEVQIWYEENLLRKVFEEWSRTMPSEPKSESSVFTFQEKSKH